MPRKLTKEDVEERIKKVHGDKYSLIGEYVNRNKKIEVLCNECNRTWDALTESLFGGFGCPRCSNRMKKTTEQFEKEVFKLVKDEYEVLGEYVNTNTKILLKHNTCGNEFMMSPKAFLNGQRCPNERYIKSAESNSLKQGDIENKIKKINDICLNEGYEVIKGYERSKKPMEILHIKCGKTFFPTPYDFIRGTRCPHCYRSKGEEVVKDFLIEYGLNFKEQFRIKECRNKRPLPFDFAIFENETLKCLIEYDGSQHFSPKFAFDKDIEGFKKLIENDSIKDRFCLENNIPLIRIKFVRSENPEIFKKKIFEKLKEELAIINMSIPSQAD